jgi:hypothetical protein
MSARVAALLRALGVASALLAPCLGCVLRPDARVREGTAFRLSAGAVASPPSTPRQGWRTSLHPADDERSGGTPERALLGTASAVSFGQGLVFPEGWAASSSRSAPTACGAGWRRRAA